MKQPPLTALLACVLAGFIGGCTGTKSVANAPTTSASSSPSSSNSPSDRDAIVAAIQKHLRANTGINLAVMEMTVDGVNINGDQAQANAEFHLKQGGTSMLITYNLERHAGDWIVLSNQPSGGQFVHPPMDKAHSGTAAPGTAAPPSTQPLPDVSDFLKNRPPVAQTSR